MAKSTQRIHLKQDVYSALKYYIADEKLRMQTKELQDLLKPGAIVNEVMKEFLKNMGHYPPKDKATEPPDEMFDVEGALK